MALQDFCQRENRTRENSDWTDTQPSFTVVKRENTNLCQCSDSNCLQHTALTFSLMGTDEQWVDLKESKGRRRRLGDIKG